MVNILAKRVSSIIGLRGSLFENYIFSGNLTRKFHSICFIEANNEKKDDLLINLLSREFELSNSSRKL